MNSDILRVLKNFIYLGLTKGIDFIVPVILLPFLVRTLGLEQFGVLSFVLAVGIYFTAIMQYGFNVTAVRDIARVRHDEQALNETFSIYLLASLAVISAASLGFAALFLTSWGQQHEMLYLATWVFCVSQALLPSWLFQGLERMKYVAITNSGIKILYVVSILFLVSEPADAFLVPLLQGLAGLIGVALAWGFIVQKSLCRFGIPPIASVWAVCRQGWPAFVTQFAPTLYTNSMTFILGLTASAKLVGIYAAATRIIDVFNALAFLLCNAFLPFLARDLSQHRWVKWLMMITGCIMLIIAYVGATWFVPLLFDNDTDRILSLVQWISPMILFIFVRFAYGPAYLMLTGAERHYQHIVVGVSALAFVIAWFVIPELAEQGAAGVLVCASGLMAVLTAIVATKKISLNAQRE